jgi:heme-degrading monooxygenase HmoA
MILEVAILNLKAGHEAGFETAFAEAKKIISAAKGFRSLELRRCVETPHRYLLHVQWDTLEDHTVGFRQSDAFGEWRKLLVPFYESLPVVEHYTDAVAKA